jgi:limonene-1,2-epoxide hydrolase
MTDTDNVRQVKEFFSRWEKSFEELCNSFHDFLAPDGMWENVGFIATYGAEQAVKDVLEPAHAKGMGTIKVDIERIGEVNSVVWSSRVDHILLPDGSLAMSVPVVAIMEFTPQKKVSSWKEYFDSSFGESLLPSAPERESPD